jgi:4a-hydroxytetrahydrobiopterin dehydratase
MHDQPLNEAEIELALSELPGWTHEHDQLTKTWQFGGHLAAVTAAAAVGHVQESLNHHGDLSIKYNTLTVSTTTHSAGNKVSEKDIDLARRIAELLN